ncbi:MAG: 3-methyl-2-oxobutanoate hydroxymethyltransferase [Waddliaceae bacterium]|nr:3-methyl-2-oxobutanoate hydroxymethyltransferase [Waddliaceae bacterium]
MNVLKIWKAKQDKKPLSMITCYDFCMAQIINQTAIDMILVGDSLSMVMHGHKTTVGATMDLMVAHTEAVVRGAPDKFVVGDLPFLSYRKGIEEAVVQVDRLMKAGAQAIKLEGARGNIDLVRHLTQSGVPIMGHLGLTPQSVHQLGGFRVQGRNDAAVEQLLKDAKDLQEAGAFATVLECVPAEVAKKVSESLDIPTIGIGAGPHVDGQVLVLQDMLGMQEGFKPKYLRTFMDGFQMISKAVNEYHEAVQNKSYPQELESYS